MDNEIQLNPPPFTGKQLAAVVNSVDTEQYKINEAYYAGKNPAIIAEGAKNALDGKDPNNVIPVPIARKSINDLKGYAYKPGNVKYEFDPDQDEAAVELVNQIFQDNNEPLESSEIFGDASIKGEGAELVWFTDKTFHFAKVKRECCLFLYSDTLKRDTLEHSIRFYDTSVINEAGQKVVTSHADVYGPVHVSYYTYEHKPVDARVKMVPHVQQYGYLHSISHNLGKVPLHPYNINEDKKGIYEASIGIINQLDQLGSDSIANAIDQFSDVILLLSKSVDDDTASDIKDKKIIDGLGGKDEGNFAEFLQRNIDLQGTIDSTLLFERWYYEFTGIPNLNSDKFNVKSGIAIAYALVSFENLVTTMETYFTKGLKYRLDLINNGLKFLDPSFEPLTAEIKWTRNLPFDIKQTAEIVKILVESGLFSEETLLKQFPQSVVKDAAEELNARDEERKKKFKDMQDSVIIPTEDEEDEQ